LLIKLIITMFAIWFAAWVIPGIAINTPLTGFVAALILGLINIIVKPIFTILTLPLTILTLGLFLLVLNGLMLMLAAYFVPGFYVSGLMAAIFGSIVISLVSSLLTGGK
ncbi:MAG: phage holin family protein, partial [Bacillota bacterium]